MQIHVILIPIPSPEHEPAGPDPPGNIYHYTTGLKLRSIINTGAIKPTTAKIEPHEKPVVWFSTSPAWEPTATKVPVPGKAGQLITAKAQAGLVRISVPASCAPYVFPQLPLIAGTSPTTCIGLLLAGLELSADPATWRFTPEPVPTALFREVEFFDFGNDRWLAVDLAELACRNWRATTITPPTPEAYTLMTATTTLLVSLLAAGLALALARENRLRRAFQDLVARLLDRIRQQSAFSRSSARPQNRSTP